MNHLLHEQVEVFLLHLQAERCCSPHTLSAYERDLRLMTEQATALGVDEVRSLTPAQVEAMADNLAERFVWKRSTSLRWLKVVKSFLTFSQRQGWTQVLSSLVHLPKPAHTLPRVWSQSTAAELLDGIGQEDFSSARDRAFFELLYGCGLRVSEACSLDLIDVQDHRVRVRGKGGKERILPLGRRALAALDHYLLHFRGDPQPALFIDASGRRVTRSMMGYQLSKLTKALGVVGSPHTWRHSYATHLMEGGADVRVIQEMMGHQSIATTSRYTHLCSSRLRGLLDQYHPRTDPN